MGTRQVVEEAQDQGEDDEDLLILRVDLINAFNQVDRDTAFKEVEDHFPEMLSWVLTCYKHQSILYFGTAVILSMAGWHQGDPLAFLLFSLALQPIIKIIAQRVPVICISAGYLDDGAIVGKKEELQSCRCLAGRWASKGANPLNFSNYKQQSKVICVVS